MSATKGIVTQVVSFAPWDGFSITPNDTTNLTKTARMLYVGGAGDISLVTPAGTTLVFKSVAVGFFYVPVAKVNATGTTATNLIGMY